MGRESVCVHPEKICTIKVTFSVRLQFSDVTKSKLILLTTQQTNKLRDKVLGQGIATSFRKPADREDGGLVSQRTIFPKLEFRLLFY